MYVACAVKTSLACTIKGLGVNDFTVLDPVQRNTTELSIGGNHTHAADQTPAGGAQSKVYSLLETLSYSNRF